MVPFAILLLPLFGFTVLALFGDAIRDQGEAKGACWLACLTVLTSFAPAAAAVYRVMHFGPARPASASRSPTSSSTGSRPGRRGPLNLLLDNRSAVMVLVVTGVGSLIHIYSGATCRRGPGRVRYFSYLNLFTFFMLLLVLGGDLPLLFVGWEGVGLCSSTC